MNNNLFFNRVISLGKLGQVTVPGKNDARYLLLLFLNIFVFYSITKLDATRIGSQYLVVVSVALISDLLLQLIIHRRIAVFPLSSFIAAHGVFLIVYSPHLWIYALISFLTVFLKFTVKYKGKHIFNPNNISIVICLILLDKYVTISSFMWKGQDLIQAVVIIFGSYIAYKVNRHFLIFSFISFYTLFGIINSYFIYNFNGWYYFWPMSGTAFSIYLFYMITDPVTSPSNKKMQLLAGFSLAGFDALLRYHEEKYSLLFAGTCNVILFFFLNRMLEFYKNRSGRTV